MKRKMNNWESGEKYSVPKSFMVDGPARKLPKPNPTPFKPVGVKDAATE